MKKFKRKYMSLAPALYAVTTLANMDNIPYYVYPVIDGFTATNVKPSFQCANLTVVNPTNKELILK